MNEHHLQKNENTKKSLCYKDGRFYFTAQGERTFYFILTLSMLAAGIIYKLWI